MKTENVRIYKSPSLDIRSYVIIFFEGKRLREYNGKRINIDLAPNNSKSIAERDYLLELLKEKYENALEFNLYTREEEPTPKIKEDPSQRIGRLEYTLNLSLENKKLQQLSSDYVRNLTLVRDSFLQFLTEKEKKAHFSKLPKARVEEFLLQYNSSSTYYMNKRRHLKVLLSECEEIIGQTLECQKKILRQKSKPKSHVPYSMEELRKVLTYLAPRNVKLYTCCLLMYGCWLRPHKEIKGLRLSHIREDFSKIVLSSTENKSGKIRAVKVPEYVSGILRELAKDLKYHDNLFSKNPIPHNKDYFSKSWDKMKPQMLKNNIIYKGQTLYSFRHTAAVNHYRKHKDVFLLQRLLGHADVQTTVIYLRSLGEISEEEMVLSVPVTPI